MPRYLTIPKSVAIDIAMPVAKTLEDGSTALALPELEFVPVFRFALSASKVWRKDAAAYGLFGDIEDKLSGKVPGDVVPLEDEEHAIFQEAVLAFEPANPDTRPYFMRLFRAVTLAPKADSRKVAAVVQAAVEPEPAKSKSEAAT